MGHPQEKGSESSDGSDDGSDDLSQQMEEDLKTEEEKDPEPTEEGRSNLRKAGKNEGGNKYMEGARRQSGRDRRFQAELEADPRVTMDRNLKDTMIIAQETYNLDRKLRDKREEAQKRAAAEAASRARAGLCPVRRTRHSPAT